MSVWYVMVARIVKACPQMWQLLVKLVSTMHYMNMLCNMRCRLVVDYLVYSILDACYSSWTITLSVH